MCDCGRCTRLLRAEPAWNDRADLGDRRAELSARTLDIPVIAVGVPTVVDLHTAAAKAGGDLRALPNLMVTPRDIDKLLSHAVRLLACALNLALHPQLTLADAEAL